MNPKMTKAELLKALQAAEKRIASLEGNGRKVKKSGEDSRRSSAKDVKMPDGETLFVRVFHSSLLPMALLESQSRQYAEVNTAFLKATEYARTQVIGKTAHEMGVFPNSELFDSLMDEVQAHGYAWGISMPVRTRTGQLRHGIFSGEFVQAMGHDLVLVAMEDVTERKAGVERRHLSEMRYRLIAENSADVIWVLDPKLGKFTYVSPSVKTLRGYTPEEVMAQPMEEALTPESGKRVREMLSEHLSKFLQGIDPSMEKPLVTLVDQPCKDGSIVHTEASVTYVFNENGEVEIVGVSRNITDRKKAEDALQASESNYRTLVENSESAIAVVSREGKILFANARSAQIWQNDALAGKSVFDLYPPDYAESYLQNIQRVIDTGEDFVDEIETVIGDRRRWFRFWLGAMRNPDGSVNSVLLNAYDISDQKQAEQDLRNANERFVELTENIEDVFWVSDPVSRHVLYASPAFQSVFGVTLEEMFKLPNRFMDLLLPEDRHILQEKRVMEGNGQKTDVKYRIRKPDGSIRWLRDKGSPVLDAGGKVIRVVGIASDITEQKDTQLELQKRAAQLALINEVGREITGVLDIQGVLSISAQLLHKTFGYHHVGVFTLETGTGELKMQNCAGNYVHVFPATHHIKPGEGIVGTVWQSGETVLVSHVEEDTRYKNFFPESIPTLSELGVPIKIGGSVVGVLDVQSPIPAAFAQDDVQVLETLADQVAQAIENARLYETVQKELSERKQAEEKNRMLTIALESAANGVIITDVQGKIEWVNPAWCQLSGFSAEEAIGHASNISKSGFHDRDFYRKMWKQIASGQVWRGEIVNRRKNGEVYTEDTTIAPVRDEHGKVINYIGVKQDITERKLAELERQTLIHTLGERVKELTALHQAARLFQTLKLSDDNAMQALVELLPQAMQYPEVAVARITLNGQSFCTKEFKQTPWMLESKFALPGGQHGKIEVGYLEERPESWQGPFMAEEKSLLETLAERMQSTIVRLIMEKDLRRRTETLSNLLEAGHALSETLNPKYMYPIIYRFITNSVPCDFVILSSYNRQTNMITCDYLHSTEGPQDVSGFPPIPLEPPGQGTQSRVIHTGESLLLSDYQAAVKTANTSMHFNEKAEIVEDVTEERDDDLSKSAIIVPLKVNGLVVGVLQVLSSELGAHTQEHLQFIEALAFHISAALSNAKLVAELEERVSLRTREVQDLYDNAPTGYHSLDADGCIVNINQTEANWLGYARDEILGHPFIDFITPETRHVFYQNFPIFKKQGWINNLEFEMTRKDGSNFPVLINATAIKDEHGNYLMSRSTVFDNTDRKKAEIALSQSEKTYRALFENANDAIFLIDMKGHIQQANPRSVDLLGFPQERLIGKKVGEMILPEDTEHAEQQKHRLLNGEYMPVYERRLVRMDGSLVETEINLSLIRNEAGEPQFIQSVIRDITARKHAERALRDSEEQNRLLFEESPEAVVLFDNNGRVARVNHAFETLTGTTRDEFTGQMITRTGILPRDLVNALNSANVDPFENKGKFAMLEFVLTHSSGEKRDISTRIYALNLHGQPHYLASMHDITTSKRAEETLRRANAEMERALRLKDEFLANMSHELRTPLNAILGISESLLEQVSGPLNEKQKKYLQTVLESAQHLLELINDILDLAKINAGRISMEMNIVSISSVAQSSLRMIRELAHKKEQKVELNIEPNVQTAWGDERRLKQMLVNLLSNAVKFTPKLGSLGLHIHGSEETNTLHFTIWDTGIGIEEKDLHMLFQPFMQLDAGLSRGNQGTGLGLALVSQMARLHGGSVSVISEPNKGSRFTISIPWKQEEESASSAPEPEQNTQAVSQPEEENAIQQKKIILLVEDTEAVTMLIHDYLELHGYEVHTAKDGLEGLELARKTHPNLILMDVMMPEMDGLESTRRIRTEANLSQVPIIALTALAMAGDRERCLAAGMNDYLSKPVQLKELLAKIKAYLGSNDGAPQ